VIPLGDAVKKVTKRALTEYFSAMLKRYQVGATISESDERALRWLIQRHPEYEQKRGCGIAKFTVMGAAYGSQCFAVVRTDGTSTDFSYRDCISPPSARADVLAAMRLEVFDDIQRAKAQRFEKYGDERGRIKSAVSDTLITIERAHADHAPPRTFNELAILFLRARGIDPDNSGLLTPPADNQFGRRLIDPELAAAWRSFHNEVAHVRLITGPENSARSQDGRPRAEDRQLILTGDAI
jgi:hypothetical protein